MNNRGPYNLPDAVGEPLHYASAIPPIEDEEGGGGFSVVQIWLMLRAHLWLSLGLFVAFVGLAYVGIKLMPKVYTATAALIVNTDTTDPLAGRNQPLFLNYSFFPTQVELINNNVILQPVVDRLKLRDDQRFNQGFAGTAAALNDVVLGNLRMALKVAQGQNSQLLYVSASVSDPQQAADIANAISEEYLKKLSERTNAPAIERAKRYSAQLAELKEKVDLAQDRVAQYRRRFGMADLKSGQAGDMEGAALADLQNKLLQARSTRIELEGRQGAGEANARDRLVQLEGQMGQLTSTLGPRHPRVLQLQAEIDATRKSITGASASELARARELENRYRDAVAAERARLLERRGLQDDGAKLLLEQQLAEETYATALRGFDQVQFASVGNYKDVTMVSAAEAPLRPSKPNKKKLFVMAIAVSFLLALGGPFAYEMFVNRRIRCRDDLERSFRIVTLAQLGKVDSAAPA